MFAHLMRLVVLVVSIVLLYTGPAAAAETAAVDTLAADSTAASSQRWALGMIMRNATIPFATETRSVSTLVPLVYYEGETVFFTGLQGGLKLYRTPSWAFSAIARLRFFDIPPELQNQVQGDQAMWGGQARYAPYGPWYLDLEVLSDGRQNVFGNVRLGGRFENPRWRVNTFAELQPKSRAFNSLYYGLDSVSVSGGSELSLGFIADYHLWTNVHLFGAGSITHLDRGVRDVPFIDRNWTSEIYAGLGLSEDRSIAAGPLLHTDSYVRVAHGWMTPSSLDEVFHGTAKKDPYNNQMTSFFYGHPLSKTLLTLPIEVFLHSGIVHHWKSEVQGSSTELVTSVKIYYTIPLPWRVKVGAAEGLSWINTVTYVERTQLAKKGFESSQLLNFLDFSADINIGDIIRNESAKSWWLGYGIHHRSAIYELSQQFGRIRGGSNIQSVYLQKSF